MTNNTASAFSNNRQMTVYELQLSLLLIQHNPTDNEPLEVIEARRIVEDALQTTRHLNGNGIVPIIDSFAYSVLKGRERIK